MTDYTRPRRPHTPSGPAQRDALDARVRAVRRRIVSGSLLGTAAFTILAGYQTLNKPTVAAAATANTAIVGDVASATATAPLFAAQGGVALTTPTATATATPMPTATMAPTDDESGDDSTTTPPVPTATTPIPVPTATTAPVPTATTPPKPAATTPKPAPVYQAPSRPARSASS